MLRWEGLEHFLRIYPNSSEPILKNISFTIKRGKRYAFVGENGAGKTTIIKLLLGFYEPCDGQIKINGKKLEAFHYGDLKCIFSVVFQDYSKYQLSLQDCLSLGEWETGSEKSNQEKILKALHTVGLDFLASEEIIKKELGKLSEESIELSEGQWQRIAIARAILSNHKIFILDEATASIDPIQEKEIYSLFETVSEDRTTIFITHRLGSTKFVDCIFTIHNGQIAEMGSHMELMEKKGVYAKMYNSQKEWYE